jgi:hypothetical protein
MVAAKIAPKRAKKIYEQFFVRKFSSAYARSYNKRHVINNPADPPEAKSVTGYKSAASYEAELSVNKAPVPIAEQ